MTKKKESYDEIRRMRNARRNAKRKARKKTLKTWKVGCLITFKTLNAKRKPKIFICRMKKVPRGLLQHSCCICRMINVNVPCINEHTSTHAKCMSKRTMDLFPCIIGRFDKHGNYHSRIIHI